MKRSRRILFRFFPSAINLNVRIHLLNFLHQFPLLVVLIPLAASSPALNSPGGMQGDFQRPMSMPHPCPHAWDRIFLQKVVRLAMLQSTHTPSVTSHVATFRMLVSFIKDWEAWLNSVFFGPMPKLLSLLALNFRFSLILIFSKPIVTELGVFTFQR